MKFFNLSFCHNHLLAKPNICAKFERNRGFELYHLLPGSGWFSHGHILNYLWYFNLRCMIQLHQIKLSFKIYSENASIFLTSVSILLHYTSHHCSCKALIYIIHLTLPFAEYIVYLRIPPEGYGGLFPWPAHSIALGLTETATRHEISKVMRYLGNKIPQHTSLTPTLSSLRYLKTAGSRVSILYAVFNRCVL